MRKFRQFLTELSARHMSVFLFPYDNFSKYQLMFTKLYMCIAMEISFGMLMGKSSQFFGRFICPPYDSGRALSFYVFIPRHTIVAGYYGFTLDVRVCVCLSVRSSVVIRPSVRPSV